MGIKRREGLQRKPFRVKNEIESGNGWSLKIPKNIPEKSSSKSIIIFTKMRKMLRYRVFLLNTVFLTWIMMSLLSLCLLNLVLVGVQSVEYLPIPTTDLDYTYSYKLNRDAFQRYNRRGIGGALSNSASTLTSTSTSRYPKHYLWGNVSSFGGGSDIISNNSPMYSHSPFNTRYVCAYVFTMQDDGYLFYTFQFIFS
jgi:hypothetical protein